MKSKKIILLFNTIKYLRWSQIFYLFYYQFLKLQLTSPTMLRLRTWEKKWKAPGRNSPQTILSLNKVIFLGEDGAINNTQDWNSTKKTKLWLYNLHYLDELNSIHAYKDQILLETFIDKWIHENPPATGNGWEPYPLSLRLINLVKWYASEQNSIPEASIVSMALQAQALVKRLEYHIRANHLFVNGKALVFVGAFFQDDQAKIWLKKGLQILDAEIKEQFLNDGGHFELSPMYHASLLWDLCDLINLANLTGLPELKDRKSQWYVLLMKGLHWLELMCHPDGEVAFFNDAACGIAPKFNEIQDYAQQFEQSAFAKISDRMATQRFSLVTLKDSGYCVVNLNDNSKAIVDVGHIGPDYQPGHAHADSLSFELSLYGQRVLVNSGTSQYGESYQRQLQRGTKAHNTVTINHENSSEVWAGFRVARRAYPVGLSTQETKECITIHCAHNGYLRLGQQNVHHREWKFFEQGLTIQDTITGQYDVAEARFYLHPDIQIHNQDGSHFTFILLNEARISISFKEAASVFIESSTWHPFFGASIKNSCLVVTFKTNKLVTEIEWRK